MLQGTQLVLANPSASFQGSIITLLGIYFVYDIGSRSQNIWPYHMGTIYKLPMNAQPLNDISQPLNKQCS